MSKPWKKKWAKIKRNCYFSTLFWIKDVRFFLTAVFTIQLLACPVIIFFETLLLSVLPFLSPFVITAAFGGCKLSHLFLLLYIYIYMCIRHALTLYLMDGWMDRWINLFFHDWLSMWNFWKVAQTSWCALYFNYYLFSPAQFYVHLLCW